MRALHPRDRRNAPEVISLSDPRPHIGAAAIRDGRIFRQSPNSNSKPSGGEGLRKLWDRLILSDVPESVVDELLEPSMIVNYSRDSFVFMQGAPTDLVFWVSSGLVDIILPGSDGEQITTSSVLGPGDIFRFGGVVDEKGMNR